MASAPRRVFTGSWGARRVFAHQRSHASFQRFADQRPWGHQRIPMPLNTIRSRSYHSGYSGSSNPNWDGLVYSIMSNLRGEYNFGPECFLSATTSDIDSEPESDSEEAKEKPQPRDIRTQVPLRLNRPWLLATAADIRLRLEVLYRKSSSHTSDYRAILSMLQTMERLGRKDEDSPKLELSEYREIFVHMRDGIKAADEMQMRIVSVKERPVLQQIHYSAECVWGVAVVNAALRRLDGTATGKEDGDGMGPTFEGDLMMLSAKINGVLLDSKDNFPEGGKWWVVEEERAVLEAVVRVQKEAGKRRNM
ncbi:hypothetical protein K458DRAFT_482718 [Lentithecium fluviatile CBS 122367]|uniref:Uncharacterized protein n=1 Tax=Lentithecium fluviatile CBS 122367 TaxID=1168545 RepID=A0A6G1JNX5_9PLEO|nr:hypothetical protein K458DRAFT_482718 [Lentithecium fluviatile CBS 122367]